MTEAVSAVKIPNFISTDPQLWFSMVESTFELASPKAITESKTKYNHCVASLPADIALLVRDIILNPDATDPYSKLKESVIARCGESSTLEIRRLLAGEQLGDRKPSELLRLMQRRADSHNVSDSLLLELFLQQLPNNVQSILASIEPLSSKKAADVADRIMEITPIQVQSTTSAPSESSDSCSCSTFLNELKQLRKEVAALRRSRSSSRNHNRSRTSSPAAGLQTECWYHRTFKEKATKCKKPCTFSENIDRLV